MALTTLLSVPSRVYAVQQVTQQVAGIPANLTFILLTLSRESWPAGDVADISITWPDGSSASGHLIGGDQPALFGGIQTASAIGVSKPAGATDAMVTVNLLQSIRTALTVQGQ